MLHFKYLKSNAYQIKCSEHLHKLKHVQTQTQTQTQTTDNIDNKSHCDHCKSGWNSNMLTETRQALKKKLLVSS